MKEELRRDYAGVLEEWRIDLAVGRMRAMGVPQSDWPDRMQELAMALREFEYDPDRANGATEETVCYEVITRTLRRALRTQVREAGRYQRYLAARGVGEGGTCEEPHYYLDAPVDLDIQQVMAGLSRLDRRAMELLLDGCSRSAVAEALDCQWGTADRARERIRRALRQAGYGGEGF